MSEKSKQCKSSCSQNATQSTTQSSDRSNSVDWDHITNYTAFMDQLVKFMEESYSFVNEYREKSGNSTHLSQMSETERIAKIKEILHLIEEKEKEIQSLEAEKAKLDQGTQQSSQWSAPSPPSNFKPWATSTIGPRQGPNQQNCLEGCLADCAPQSPQYGNMSYAGAPAYYNQPIPGPSMSRTANRSLTSASRAQQRSAQGQIQGQSPGYYGTGCDPACQFNRM